MTASVPVARAVAVEFGRRVRERRMAVGLKQSDLADRAGIRVAFISRIERLKGNPSLVTMALIAQALECSLPDLIPR
jgi:HTH-type transcriptional regulator / antitoxin HipB